MAKIKPRRQPAERVEMRPITKIIPYDRNPRTHGEEQIKLLANLMKKYGVDQPIVVDEKGVILKGHGRRMAAIKAGLTHYPVVIQRGLKENDKRALRIADNQVALLSGWDDELIKMEVGELKLAGSDMSLLGFSDTQLTRLGGGETDIPAVEFKAMFQVLIECENEQDQLRTIEKLQKDGIKCRALIA